VLLDAGYRRQAHRPKIHVPSLTIGPYYSQLGILYLPSCEYIIL